MTRYLEGKLATLWSMRAEHPVCAELGRCGGEPGRLAPVLSAYPGRPCVIVYQGEDLRRGVPSALALIEVEGGLVRRVDLGNVVPSPSSAIRTGDFPGLAGSPFES